MRRFLPAGGETRAAMALVMLVAAGCGDGGGALDMAAGGGQCQWTAPGPLPQFCTDHHGHVCTSLAGEACAYCAGVTLGGGVDFCRVVGSDGDGGTSTYLCLTRCDGCSYKGAPDLPCSPGP